jgi:hypothetical protein
VTPLGEGCFLVQFLTDQVDISLSRYEAIRLAGSVGTHCTGGRARHTRQALGLVNHGMCLVEPATGRLEKVRAPNCERSPGLDASSG